MVKWIRQYNVNVDLTIGMEYNKKEVFKRIVIIRGGDYILYDHDSS